MAKCLDCNYFLCSGCFTDHQNIAAFANHQVVNSNNVSVKEEIENDETLGEQIRKQSTNQLNTSVNSQMQNSFKQQQNTTNQIQISNLQQLQQQFNNLEDQLRVKNKQQQSLILGSQQHQQHQRLLQIETEIQKSYNFYTQMLKERKDYLINELNTIVQYAVLNHNQNYNKQLKLKAELEQKRANLELSDSMQSFMSNDPSKASPLNDLNNNKINNNIVELNNLSMINNQIIAQLKANNPLSQIEFVSNYSAIQTSIRNTFGYIRINNQMNSQQNVNQQPKQEMSFNNEQLARNLNNSASVYDYLNQMAKNQTQRSKTQNELHIDLETSNMPLGSIKNGFNNDGGNGEGQFDYFGNSVPSSQSINTFSASSTGSSKSTNSSVVTST
jgi:hypothetical protein